MAVTSSAVCCASGASTVAAARANPTFLAVGTLPAMPPIEGLDSPRWSAVRPGTITAATTCGTSGWTASTTDHLQPLTTVVIGLRESTHCHFVGSSCTS